MQPRYTDSLDAITPNMLTGFFEGWPNPPSPATHLQILRSSAHIVLAIDDERNRVIGFINAISDGILSAYIPLLEVLPEHRRQGVGTELVSRMLGTFHDLYMIDLTCDPGTQPFYESCGMMRSTGMMCRDFAHQSGAV
ncbi:MAG: GNAT family N-acetyltransferase [Phycisphaerales bacterium]|nr:GNAT family N-acetyltransferase [Phycisphaerales bacterium]